MFLPSFVGGFGVVFYLYTSVNDIVRTGEQKQLRKRFLPNNNIFVSLHN